jgi:glutamate-ammonia-ligase adenylyltransferase
MALTRARVVAATPGFAPEVEGHPRRADRQAQRQDHARRHHRHARRHRRADKGDETRWDLKHARGGLIDIEFVAQALQLVHGARHPDILDTNTARVLDRAAAAGLLKAAEAEVLREACRFYQRLTQIIRLCLVDGFDPVTAAPGLKRLLARAGELPDFVTLDAYVGETQAAVRASFERIIGRIDNP